MTKLQLAERDKAREDLRELFVKNEIDTVYTIFRHVSQSGMMRVIDLVIIGKDRRPLRITSWACKATGNKYNGKHQGMEIGGCGMDMGFAAVYDLSMSLYCPGEYNHDAAYKLHQEWL